MAPTPSFPTRLLVCTALIGVVGFIVNAYMVKIDAELIMYGLSSQGAIAGFYGNGTPAYTNVTATLATATLTAQWYTFILVNFIFCSAFFVSSLMVVHSLIIRKGHIGKINLDTKLALDSVPSPWWKMCTSGGPIQDRRSLVPCCATALSVRGVEQSGARCTSLCRTCSSSAPSSSPSSSSSQASSVRARTQPSSATTLSRTHDPHPPSHPPPRHPPGSDAHPHPHPFAQMSC
jgi:hypothetical protein